MTIQSNNNNLNHLIDLTFTKVSRQFPLSFEEFKKDYFSHFYVPNIEIKELNVLINRKSLFDLPVKKEEPYEKIIEMNRNNDNTTGNLLDYK